MRVSIPPYGRDPVQRLRRHLGDVYAAVLVLLALTIGLLMLALGGALGQAIGAVLIFVLLVIVFRAGARTG